MARRDIDFDAEGVTLRGWFYTADGRPVRRPPSSWRTASRPSRRCTSTSTPRRSPRPGFNALVFDNRNFGASDGEPRQEIDPWAQVRDYRHAITYATTLPEVDGGRIGVWGSSYSGGHVLVVAAIDRRVKAVVSQVPLVSGHDNFRALVRADFIDGFRALFDADRLARYEGKEPGMVPVVDEDPLGAVGAAHPGLLHLVHRDPRPARAVVAQRGHAAQRRAVHRVRAGRLRPLHQPDPAAADARAERRARPRPTWRSPRTRRRASRRSCRSCPAGTSTPTSTASTRPARPPATGSCSTSEADH